MSSKIKIHDNYNNGNNCIVVKVVTVVVPQKMALAKGRMALVKIAK